ncbi:helix-turn-helix domain-containing protein [Streptomyces sp. NPDC001634]
MSLAESSRTGDRALRADAARNRRRIGQETRRLFQERGLDAPLDEVAERAGVGAGTLYRQARGRSTVISPPGRAWSKRPSKRSS